MPTSVDGAITEQQMIAGVKVQLVWRVFVCGGEKEDSYIYAETEEVFIAIHDKRIGIELKTPTLDALTLARAILPEILPQKGKYETECYKLAIEKSLAYHEERIQQLQASINTEMLIIQKMRVKL